ncbi:MAG: hypothetical protein OEW75_12960, partial [Cyclobacteriaceae bacterium]|nr:hypothetical protein [Cyclobacteriaceae bacterium]
LNNTVLGNEGGMRYKHVNTLEKINHLVNPYFISLFKGDRLLGTINLTQRAITPEGTNSYYIRYFSFFESYKSKHTGKKKGKSSSVIKQEIEKAFINGPDNRPEEKAIYYAYVEINNERSARVCREFNFEPQRLLNTSIFSRFYPKGSKNVFKINEQEKKEVINALDEFYTGYTMYQKQVLFKSGEYYVLKENGKIVAGVQATPTKWIINEIPGLSGKIILNIMPLLPILSKIFNPKNYNFLSYDYFFCKKGSEHKINELFEAVLYTTKHYSGIIWSDHDSDEHKLLKKYCSYGIMNKIKKDVPANIILRFNNYTESEKLIFKEKPAFVSSFDLT